MALIVFKNDKRTFMTAEAATRLWLVKTGEKKGNVRDRALVNRIAKFYLNRTNAPESYLTEYPDPRNPETAVQQTIRLPYID